MCFTNNCEDAHEDERQRETDPRTSESSACGTAAWFGVSDSIGLGFKIDEVFGFEVWVQKRLGCRVQGLELRF